MTAARGAGMSLVMMVDGEPRPVPAVVDLTAYRLVQEALTNARRHAPGAAVSVELTYATTSACGCAAAPPLAPVAPPPGLGMDCSACASGSSRRAAS